MKFAVLALPRSGTAWAANWLSCYGIPCLHEPLTHYMPDQIPGDVGVACTGLWLGGAPNCPYVILDRPIDEIDASCRRAGLPCVPRDFVDRFAGLPGYRVPWTWLFCNPKPIWDHLRSPSPFDPARHARLKQFNVQRDLRTYEPRQDVIRHMLGQQTGALAA